MRNIRQRVTHTLTKELVPAESLVAEPQCWAALDYETLESCDICGTATWTISRESLAHGLTVWFDSILTEGIGFSNAPGLPEIVYGRAFFPWPEPVSLKTGDMLSVTLRANFVGADYVWSWETSLMRDGRKQGQFRQSSFNGTILSPARLRKHASDYQPVLTEAGEVERFILTLMDGRNSLEKIAHDLYDRFPQAFTSFDEARSRVGNLSERYSR
jgi:protein arginine N-methyltransferase 1